MQKHSSARKVNRIINRGLLFLENDRFEEALAVFTAAKNMDPKAKNIHTYTGLAYLHLGDYYQAIKEFEAALRENPKDAIALAYRGEARFALKDYDISSEAYIL